MNARVIAVMAANHGLITRAQAIEAGMSPERIDRLVRSGVWTAVRRGVYAETSYWSTLPELPDRRLLLDRAASMRISVPHRLSHESAAYLLDLPILRPAKLISHVTRPGVVGSHLRHGVKHHRAPHTDDQVVEVDGLLCLDAVRAALDITREHGYEPGLVAADSALRAGATRVDLERAAAAMVSWPFKTVVDDVVASADPGADSPGDTLARVLVTELGYGVPEVQFGLTADGRTAWCDLRLGRHVFEFDGRAKYQRIDEWGYADRDPDDVLWEEKTRQDWVCGFKLGMSRIIWEDFWGPARQRAKERLDREFLDTCARFGTDVSDLAPFRPRGPRPRPVLRRRQPRPWSR